MEVSSLLRAAKAAGLKVRGYQGLVHTRGSGTIIRASSITTGSGEPVAELTVSPMGEVIEVRWDEGPMVLCRGAEGVARAAYFTVAVSDDGDLLFRLIEPRDPAAVPEEPTCVVPEDPAWH